MDYGLWTSDFFLVITTVLFILVTSHAIAGNTAYHAANDGAFRAVFLIDDGTGSRSCGCTDHGTLGFLAPALLFSRLVGRVVRFGTQRTAIARSSAASGG